MLAHLLLGLADADSVGARIDQEERDHIAALAVGAALDVGLRPHQEDAGVGAGGDPCLRPVDPPALVGLHGPRRHASCVGAAPRLAQAERACQRLAAGDGGDPARPLGVGAEGLDDLADHVVDAHRHGDRRVRARDLRDGEAVGDDAGVGAAVSLADVDAHQPEAGHAAQVVGRELAARVASSGRRSQRIVAEAAGDLL